MTLAEKIDRLLENVKAGALRGRGRPRALDERMARQGYLPASVAAKVADRHVSRIYRAHDAGQLRVARRKHYRYVLAADLVRWVGRLGGES